MIRALRRAISAPIAEIILVIVAVSIALVFASYIIQKVNITHEETAIKQPLVVTITAVHNTPNGINLTIIAENKGLRSYKINYVIIDGGNFMLEKELYLTIEPSETKIIKIGYNDWDIIKGTLPYYQSRVTIKVIIYVEDIGPIIYTEKI